MYDFIIKNGLLFDASLDAPKAGDLYIKGGRLVAPGSHGPDEAAEIIDAAGKYVVPGLIDPHVHVHYDGNADPHADLLCPPSGVTVAVDGGSVGWRNYPLFAKLNQLRYVTTVKSFLHVSPFGVLNRAPGETHDPAMFDEEAILGLLAEYPHDIVGLKFRLDSATLGEKGLAPFRRAQEIADKAKAMGLPSVIDVHCANLPASVDVREILDMMRPGDIFAHFCQNRGQTIFTGDGHVISEAKRARERGVLFDSCHGRTMWSFGNLRKALDDGFPPDLIGSDIVRGALFVRPGFSLLHAMNLWLNVGFEPTAILKTVTANPARALGLDGEFGLLAPGRRADVAVLDIIDTPIRLFDCFGEEIKPSRAFVPLMTVNKGEIVFRQTFF